MNQAGLILLHSFHSAVCNLCGLLGLETALTKVANEWSIKVSETDRLKITLPICCEQALSLLNISSCTEPISLESFQRKYIYLQQLLSLIDSE